MAQKAIEILSNDPTLAALCDDLNKIEKEFDEQRAFVQKQMDTVSDRAHDQSMQVWDKIADRLKANGKLPADYTREKSNGKGLAWDEEAGYIYQYDLEDDDPRKKLAASLAGIFGPRK